MDQKRYRMEYTVLANRLGENLFKFFNVGRPNACLVAGARTNRGNVYTLHMELGCFPNDAPEVYVTRMLYDRRGNPLDSPSGDMHVLAAKNGWTRICHYGRESWTPNVSLFKVYVKCRLWLEMYELHLQTGHNIDYYLNHQE